MGEDEQAAPPVPGGMDADRWAADLLPAVSAAIAAHDAAALRALVAGLPAPDAADVIELLAPEERVAFIEMLGPALDFEVFSELDAPVRDQLSEALPNEFLAAAVTELETDDAAYLLASLEKADREEVLAKLAASDRKALERNFDYPEETAGRLMQADFVAVAPFWTAGQVIDFMREAPALPDRFSEIFVVDPAYRVLGSLNLSRLLRSKRDVPVSEIMDTDRHTILATADQEDVARQFERYGLMSAPVVDQNGRLAGMITVDDIVEVIQSEADEDMRALGGVGDERLADSVFNIVKSRVPWLAVNLATATLASTVIKQFDATIAQMVVLAVLMPIVASVGGNAGTQTMTVTVRGLALNKLGRVNARRVIAREALTGLANGLVLSALLASVVFVWFGSGWLGGVIAAALIVNLLVAALAGILIPLTLDRLGFDPAPASGVFVTMLTDVIGFFAFLGLASLLLL